MGHQYVKLIPHKKFFNEKRHKAVRFCFYQVQDPEKLFSGYQYENSSYSRHVGGTWFQELETRKSR